MVRLALTLTLLAILTTPAAAGPFCTCRANGQDYRQGQILCIRGKLSRCEMNQNVTSWKVLADTCPEARSEEVPNLYIRPPGESRDPILTREDSRGITRVFARSVGSRLSPG